ncbi:hypothetical protein CpB0109 [Chlamydia pneumoniae TW-183]|uniref:Uncharacterized protein n=1 Tax=Chlamydia pneumoniae TaxID=83558 RepID=A0ABM5LC04_CHLPN|nr:hypothetical protein CpB0109 [Chlamydia pneumoniae TW-183]
MSRTRVRVSPPPLFKKIILKCYSSPLNEENLSFLPNLDNVFLKSLKKSNIH